MNDWLRKAGSGLYRGKTLSVICENKNYGLVRFPGYMCWLRIGSQSYAKVGYYYIRKGDSLLRSPQIAEGRQTKAQMEKLKAGLPK